jgi:hypothetical protein
MTPLKACGENVVILIVAMIASLSFVFTIQDLAAA